MIFVTVGTQLPFDRLIAAVDGWALSRNRDDVVAQVGPSTYNSLALKCYTHISPDEYAQFQRDADLFVSHAGMGGIISALELGKPLIIMPRKASLGEHRNDHQLATVRQFAGYSGIYVAENVDDLIRLLDNSDRLFGNKQISSSASDKLLYALKSYIATTSEHRKS